MQIRPLSPRVVALHIVGQDRGELGDKPFLELEARLRAGPYELFIDARDALSPSLDVSGVWAAWLMKHRAQLVRVNLLTRQRFIQLTADFVQRFGKMDDRMRIYTDIAAFEAALSAAMADDAR